MDRRHEPNLLLLSIPVLFVLGGIGVWAWLTRPPASGMWREPTRAKPAWVAWPWPQAQEDHPHLGVKHWVDKSSPDGSTLDLVEFDLDANPGLRLEMYDQDMDDAKPFDDKADYYAMGVGQATRHLNDMRPGQVIAAWNGLFFGYSSTATSAHVATHVGPAVIDSKAHYNVGNPRWTFGVKYDGVKPSYKALYQPPYKGLGREIDYGGAGAQYLVRDGRPMKLQSPPKAGDPPLKQPVPCGPDDCGHIPSVDFMRTSRTSMGWSKGSRKFFVLIVREPDNEVASKLATKYGRADQGGWTVADLQKFWLKRGAWGAVNIDGGIMTQLTCLRNDGKYDLLPPSLVAPPNQRLVFDSTFQGAPQGGTLMYFYFRDVGP